MTGKGTTSAGGEGDSRGRDTREVYGLAAPDYFRAGWQPLPLPPKSKTPPPGGYTGEDGKLIGSIQTIKLWTRNPKGAAGNLALRLVHPFVGIDVDTYASKRGADTLAAAEAAWGKLPPTLVSSARGEPLVSGIRIFRLPQGSPKLDGTAGTALVPFAAREVDGRPYPDIDVIHMGHRYVVAWPSVHPDTREVYRWYVQHEVYEDGSGGGLTELDRVPDLSMIAELPPSWCEGLVGTVSTRPGSAVSGGRAAPLDPVRAQARAQAVDAAIAAADNGADDFEPIADDELDDLGIDVASAALQVFTADRAAGEIKTWINRLRAARKGVINDTLKDTASHVWHFVPHFISAEGAVRALVDAQRVAWLASGMPDDGDTSGAVETIRRTISTYVPEQTRLGLWWVAVPDDEPDDAGKAEAAETSTEAADPTEIDDFDSPVAPSRPSGSSGATSGASGAADWADRADGVTDEVAAMLALREQRRREKAEGKRADPYAQMGEQARTDSRAAMLEQEITRQEIRDEARDEVTRRREAAGKEAAKSRAGVYRETRVHTLTQMRSREPVPFLTEHWLPASCVARTFGASGTYKTFLLLDWAIHLALGRAWHGCAVPEEGTRVMWVAGEGEDDIAERIDAWLRQHDEAAVYVQRLEQNLLIHPGAVQIMDDGEWWDFAAMCEAEQVGFVVLDTQSTSTIGMNENDPSETNNMLARCRALAHPSGKPNGPAVMLVHHTGHQGGRARGASSGFAGLDVEIEVAATGEPLEVQFRHQKIKRRARQDWQTLKLVPQGDSLAITDIDASDKIDKVAVVDAVKSAAERLALGVTPTTTELVAYVLRRYHHGDPDGTSLTTVAANINDLRNEWGLTKPGGYKFAPLKGNSASMSEAVGILMAGEETGRTDENGLPERLAWVEKPGKGRYRLTEAGCAHFGWPNEGAIPDASPAAAERPVMAAISTAIGAAATSADEAAGAVDEDADDCDFEVV